MKIFNWVHRKFHNKDGLNAEKGKKTNETQALLEQVDGWREGILTIGTFGFDPLKDFNQIPYLIANEENIEDEEYEDGEQYELEGEYCYEFDEEEEGELNPLVNCNKQQQLGIKDPSGSENAPAVSEIVLDDASTTSVEFDLNKDKKKGERITLADLFSADSDDKSTTEQQEEVEAVFKKADPHAKTTSTGLSFAKKLIPKVGEDSRPIHKIHRMMTRMLKRKIHPELEGKIQKKETQIKKSVLGVVLKGRNESVSLLQTQDATGWA